MKKFFLLCITLLSFQFVFAQKTTAIEGELLVSFKNGINPINMMERFQTYEGVATGLKIEKQISKPMNIWKLSYNFENLGEDDVLYWLRSQSEVAIAQLNHGIQYRVKTPNDSLFSKQWQWNNTGQTGGKIDADVDAPEAWDITTGGLTPTGDTIVVAVLDDGTDYNHPDLKQNHWRNLKEIPNNNIDDDQNGYVDDYNGWNPNQENDNVDGGAHGVSVSGMIGAKSNNSIGVAGLNWNVKIMSISPIPSLQDESSVIAAYAYALTMRTLYNKTKGAKGAFVVATNASWGIDKGKPANAPIWCAFYDTLGVAGILNVGATTNNSTIDVDKDGDLPTACPSDYMLSVQMSDSKDFNKSGFGKTQVDVAAPGSLIYTTSQNGGYTTTSGTSFAAPLTAGLVALMYAAPCLDFANYTKKDPANAALLIKDYLMQSCDPVAELKVLNVTGGRVNAFKSLQTMITYCGACVPPKATVTAFEITKNTAKVVWVKPDSTTKVNLRWRALNTANWINSKDKTSPFTFVGLKSCTEYEFQLQSICGTDSSAWGKSNLIKTEGCCVNPTFTVGNIGKNTIEFIWKPESGVKSYEYRYRKTTTAPWTTIASVTSPLKVIGLDSCTLYDVQLRTVCDSSITAWTTISTFKTIGCGACLDFGYCKGKAISATFEYIKKVKINTINQTSAGSAGGYGNYTGGKKTALTTGSSYDIFLTAGFSSPTFPTKVYFRTWIDLDQNGTFDNGEDLVFDAKKTVETEILMGTITIPWSAKLGTTRMRVKLKPIFGTDPLFMNPCDTASYGETEDYCVDIVNGFVPCAQVPNYKISKILPGAATVRWDTVAGAIAYNVRYRPFGEVDWKVENTIGSQYMIKPLPDCKKFEVQVRTVCENDLSGYTASLFPEYCPVPTKDADKLLEALNVYPVPFSNALYTEFSLTESSNVNVEVFNTNGQKMLQNTYQNLAAQRHNLAIEGVSDWATGLYWVKISTEKGATIRKVMKVE